MRAIIPPRSHRAKTRCREGATALWVSRLRSTRTACMLVHHLWRGSAFSTSVTLNLFQGPFVFSSSECVARWILKQVQDDEKGERRQGRVQGDEVRGNDSLRLRL